MSKIVHTEQCKKATAAQDAWDNLWPNACHNCNAEGGFRIPGGPEEPEDYDMCSKCEGNCPRCGTPMAPEEYELARPCVICGYAWGKNLDDYRPSYECECWLGEDYFTYYPPAEEEFDPEAYSYVADDFNYQVAKERGQL